MPTAPERSTGEIAQSDLNVMDELADQDLHQVVLSRMAERAQAIEVDIDTV